MPIMEVTLVPDQSGGRICTVTPWQRERGLVESQAETGKRNPEEHRETGQGGKVEALFPGPARVAGGGGL